MKTQKTNYFDFENQTFVLIVFQHTLIGRNSFSETKITDEI